MWNNLVELLQDPSYKRLGLALAASLALHIFLLGKLDLTLPSLKKELHVIEARIQMPKAVVKPAEKPIETPIPEEVIAPEPELEPPVEAKPEVIPEPESLPEPVVVNPAPVVAEAVQPPASTPVPSPVNKEPEPAPPEPEPEPQPIDIGLVINENAYQYVETDFDVRTEIDGSAVGKATITYNLTDGSHYQLKWLTEGRGLAALIFPDLLQTSEGVLIKTGLQPSKYLYQFGNKTDKTRTASFDWPNKIATLQTSKGTQTVDLDEGTQDLLSFMYQFMYVAPLQTMQIPIATGKKLARYDYSFEGEEILNIKIGELKTIHIVHSGGESDEKTELWLAIDYQYIPVKIRKIEKNGDVVEMVATRINTNRPTVNNSINN
jgi:Protein of unknown function (DUF3108)